MFKTFSIVGFFFISSINAAVHIGTNDDSQAMVLPFYTVANGLNTLLTIDNSSDQYKAVKINLRSNNQADALHSFNLYIPPKDMWVAVIAQLNNNVQVLSNDQTCTLNLSELSESQALESNWNTGLIEVFEMGTVDESIFGDSHTSEHCQILDDAWNGQTATINWRDDPTTSMQAVSSGIRTSASIIDVLNGFSFDVPVLNLSGFFSTNTIAHHAPESNLPDLASGETSSMVIYNGQAVTTNWPTGYEAVSALIMKTGVENEFSLSAFLGAESEWILSFPTWQHHLSNPDSSAPFVVTEDNEYQLPGDFSRGFYSYDRTGHEFSFNTGLIDPPPPPHEEPFSFSVINYVFFNNMTPATSALSGQIDTHIVPFNIRPLDSSHSGHDHADFEEGKIKLNFLLDTHYTPNTGGDNGQYHGLPVFGFAFQKFYNASAQPGLLATYALAKEHIGTVLIDGINP